MEARPRLELRRMPFQLGDWVVHPTRNRLERDGVAVVLRPKAMDVLAALAARPGEVVTRDALMSSVWPGSFAGDGVLCRAVFELREALHDPSHQPRYVETVARRGYRLAQAVVELPATPPPPAEAGPVPAAPSAEVPGRRRRLVLVAAAAMLTMGSLLGTSHLRPAGTAHARPVPRVAVLPFENLGGPGDEFLGAGLAEEISGRLAELRGLDVVPSSLAFSAVDRKAGTVAIGRRLAADFLVTGGTRWDHATNRVRVTPRVIRVADEAQIWAEVLDRGTGDLLRVQAEIAATVAGRLQVVVQQSELASLQDAPTTSAEAYRAYLEGRWHTRRPRSSGEGLLLAVRLQERATTLDPSFAEAWAELARDHADLYHVGGDAEADRCRQARKAAERASTLAPHKPAVHLASALICYWCDKDFEAALRELDQAKGLHADLGEVWEAEAWIRRRQGRWAEAVASFRAALELKPRDPLALTELGVTMALLRRFEEAQEYLARAATIEPDNPVPFIAASDIERRRGDLAAARLALARAPRQDSDEVQCSWAVQTMFERDFEAALRHLGEATGQGSRSVGETVWMLEMRGELLTLAGRAGEARAAFARAVETAGAETPDGPGVTSTTGPLAMALAGVGRVEEARRLAERLRRQCDAATDAVDCAFDREYAARALAFAGDREQAMTILESLLEEPSALTRPVLELDPVWSTYLRVPSGAGRGV